MKLFLRLPLGSPCRPLAGHDGFRASMSFRACQRGEKRHSGSKAVVSGQKACSTVSQDSLPKTGTKFSLRLY